MYAMRGEFCIGVASVLSFVSLVLLLFVHVGTINTSKVPRNINMVQVNMSGYHHALELATQNVLSGVYTDNASAPLGEGLGLRQNYYYGLYAFCGYLNETGEGKCSNHTLGQRYQPFEALLADASSRDSRISQSFIPDTTAFTNSKYTGQSSKAAYWMILPGTICAALALATGIPKSNYTFGASTIFAIAGSFLLLIGASIWTVMIKKTQDINELIVVTTTQRIPLGITVSLGPGLLILWAAFATLAASVVPYMVSCCTWRG